MLDYVAKYEETSSTALSANQAVAVPLLTVNGWILMQRKVTGGSLSFGRNWAAYRNGFGSFIDNYWLGLDRVYRLMQTGSVTLRVEVCKLTQLLCYLVRAKLHYTDTGYANTSKEHYHRISLQQVVDLVQHVTNSTTRTPATDTANGQAHNNFYNKFATSQCQSPTSGHV